MAGLQDERISQRTCPTLATGSRAMLISRLRMQQKPLTISAYDLDKPRTKYLDSLLEVKDSIHLTSTRTALEVHSRAAAPSTDVISLIGDGAIRDKEVGIDDALQTDSENTAQISPPFQRKVQSSEHLTETASELTSLQTTGMLLSSMGANIKLTPQGMSGDPAVCPDIEGGRDILYKGLQRTIPRHIHLDNNDFERLSVCSTLDVPFLHSQRRSGELGSVSNLQFCRLNRSSKRVRMRRSPSPHEMFTRYERRPALPVSSSGKILTLEELKLVATSKQNSWARNYLRALSVSRLWYVVEIHLMFRSLATWKSAFEFDCWCERDHAARVLTLFFKERCAWIRRLCLASATPRSISEGQEKIDSHRLDHECRVHAVHTIQSWYHYRKRANADLRKKLESACLIQRTYRKHRRGIAFAMHLRDKSRRTEAAVVIQRHVRGHQLRKMSNVYAKLHKIASDQAYHANLRDASLKKFLYDGSALRIQQWWKKCRLERNRVLLVQARRTLFAIRIQGAVRNYLSCKEKQIADREHAAASLIQRYFRARHELEVRRFVKAKERHLKKLEMNPACKGDSAGGYPTASSSVKLKEYLRFWGPREISRHQSSSKKSQHESALAIQRMYRRWKGISMAKNMRYRAAVVAALKRQMLLKNTAKRIQSSWRVRQRRKQTAAALIQRAWKRHHFRERISAALSIQMMVRWWIASKRVNKLRMRLKSLESPTVRIQALIRGWLSRKRSFHRKLMHIRLVDEQQFASASCARMIRKRYLSNLPSQLGRIASKSGISQAEFSKMIKSSGILCPGLEVADIDLMFTQMSKAKKAKKLDSQGFVDILCSIAEAIYPEVDQYDNFSCFDASTSRLIRLSDEHLFQAPWALQHRVAALKQTEYDINMCARIIQKNVRGWAARTRAKQELLEDSRRREATVFRGAAIKIQCLIRRKLSLKRLAIVAQSVIEKYWDPISGDPYWVNTRSGCKTWKKPAALGVLDCFRSVMLPDHKTELVIKCGQCMNVDAQCMCLQCSESFCARCFDRFHTRGSSRRSHATQPLYTCSTCQYQHASYQVTRHKETQYFCDVCFVNQSQHKQQDNMYAGDAVKRLLLGCVECDGKFTVRWFCSECNEFFCTTCYAKLHAHSSKIAHLVERLHILAENIENSD